MLRLLLRCVSESRATVTVAAAVAGLQAGSFLDSCISLALSPSHTHSHIPKGFRSSLLYDNYL